MIGKVFPTAQHLCNISLAVPLPVPLFTIAITYIYTLLPRGKALHQSPVVRDLSILVGPPEYFIHVSVRRVSFRHRIGFYNRAVGAPPAQRARGAAGGTGHVVTTIRCKPFSEVHGIIFLQS